MDLAKEELPSLKICKSLKLSNQRLRVIDTVPSSPHVWTVLA